MKEIQTLDFSYKNESQHWRPKKKVSILLYSAKCAHETGLS